MTTIVQEHAKSPKTLAAWLEKHRVVKCLPLHMWDGTDESGFFNVPPCLDHAMLFETDTGELILVSQPYPFGDGTAREMLEYADKNNTNFTVHAHSWWNHGRTLLIEWRWNHA